MSLTTIIVGDNISSPTTYKRYISIPTHNLKHSELFTDIIRLYNYNGCNDYTLVLPQKYNTVANLYIDYLNDNNNSIQQCFCCTTNNNIVNNDNNGNRDNNNCLSPQQWFTIVNLFELCHYIMDDNLFSILVQNMLDNWTTCQVVIGNLIPVIQRQIYLFCPLVVIPASYYDDMTFLYLWAKRNDNKSITVDNKYTYYSDTIFYDDGHYLLSINSYHKNYVTDTKQQYYMTVEHGLHKSWYMPDVNGKQQVMEMCILDHSKIIGCHCFWYPSGEFKKISRHSNGKCVSCDMFTTNGFRITYLPNNKKFWYSKLRKLLHV